MLFVAKEDERITTGYLMQVKEHNKNNKVDILNEPIAIIGMNCQFPGMDSDIIDVDAFYDMLLKEQTPIRDVPENRWDNNKYYDGDRQKEDKIVSRKGGFIDDPSLFDASFFKISASEAKQIDPQHRLFLEVSIRALNHANIRLDSLYNSNTGVYCGIATHDYSQLNYKDKITFNAYTCLGAADSAAAGRLCYFLNLKGPSITVDTACSSSLSSLYIALTALRNQQCDMAIVGGVHLNLCPEVSVGLSKAKMLSAMGQCNSFDAKADGYVRSEGCSVVIIKRLSDAINEKNNILAVINSVVMNQDGAGSGLAAPNIEAQIAMHQSVLTQANLQASDIDYIETHGTGTVVGDAVEFNALKHIHKGHHSKDKPLIIGALKSNLGHTISASGIAAVIKVVKALNNETIPANLHYSTPNAAIDPDGIPAAFPIKATKFDKRQNRKRYVQVSNFGFTGTNVTAIIEEFPYVPIVTAIKDKLAPVCFVASANSEHSLQQMLTRYLEYLKKSTFNLEEVCHALINNRDHYKFRCAIMADNKESLIKKIESINYEIKKVSIKKDIVITNSDPLQISDYYLSGLNIRLEKNNEHNNSVDLPLYIFDRKPYWHDNGLNDDVSEVKEYYKEENIPKDWCFQLTWENQPLDRNNQRIHGDHWLYIGDKQYATGFMEQGMHLVLDGDDYSINDLNGIIFAESLSTTINDTNIDFDFQNSVVKKLLGLVKELNQKAIELPLIVLTTNIIPELTVGKLNLTSSVLQGFCKTLTIELPQYNTVLIDVDKIDNDVYSSQVVNEINYNHGSCYENIVAYRAGRRMVSRLTNSTFPAKKTLVHGQNRYLISGGCGGLGLVTAQALLSSGAKEIILVSRTIDTPSLISTINKIRSRYPNQIIRTVSLDIIDKEKLCNLIVKCNKDGLLKGIVHAAGASNNAPLVEHQEEDIDYLFAAKVQGGWNLHQLSQQHCKLDFFVVYSSISSVFGSNKESVYSASNSFLDALIAQRHHLGLVGGAIQWGPWAEAGMAEKRSRDKILKQALIHNEQGKALIQLLINNQEFQTTIISPEYLNFMLDFIPKPMPGFYQSLADSLNRSDNSSDNNLSLWLNEYFQIDDDKKFTVCKSMLIDMCKELLDLQESDEIDEDDGFFDLGFDSLLIAAIASGLNEKLQSSIHLPATIAFDYPTIAKLSKYIESELAQYSSKTKALKPDSDDGSIAIVGMSCELPGASGVAAFERMLEEGLNGIKDISIERWDNTQYYDPDPEAPGKSYVQQLGMIDGIYDFDASFFGISPREAPMLDPQQRLFLEHSYKALEHANYPPQSLRGSLTGVFAGVGSSHEYYSLLEKAGFSDQQYGMFSITGKALNMVPGRVAYTFDFKGPSLSIDTACSSSLVAIHYACQSLKNREIDFALAGGVNVLFRPECNINLCKAKALSPQSRCKTFDKNADGYARSEGCGVLFLKRLTDAKRDKDCILAVIKASAVNNDGQSVALTVPNGKSQEEVMSKALSQTSLSACDIGYIETHGTGTPLGDPIEVHAINNVYGLTRHSNNPLYLGAVKTNIGHLESASGIASLIKVTLSLQKNKIYQNINFNELNPNINLGNSRLSLKKIDWKSNEKLNSAAVNAFGFSGTNSHIILQEFPENALKRKHLPIKINILILSAKTETALMNLKKSYINYLDSTTHSFSDICFTAATCRDHYRYRLAVAAKTISEAMKLLDDNEYTSSYEKQEVLAIQHYSSVKLLVNEYLQGKKVDWRAYYEGKSDDFIKVKLPHYVFDKRKYQLQIKKDNSQQLSQTLPPSLPHDGCMMDTKACLEHLYSIKWQLLDSSNLTEEKIPTLWVITNNKVRAEKLLGIIEHKLIENVMQLEDIENKNIIFLFEKKQFTELFHCCQYLFKHPPLSFILVTQNAYAIADSCRENTDPYHTMASSFWKSFRNELELKKNHTIDIDANNNLDLALKTVFNTKNVEPQFAARELIYVPRLILANLSDSPVRNEYAFDPEASYLITGGTGGLAKPLIDYLITRGAKHIVLTSRSDCTLDLKVIIEKAKRQHVIIRHFSVDSSNLEQMKKIIDGDEENLMPLKGIFHLAGVLGDNLLINLTEEQLNQVLSAKMKSAQVLHQLTKTIPLDLFVLFSSSASILGSRGQANYVAANGFLDGLAHLRNQMGLAALAINWGAFHTIGMAAKNIQSLQRRGFIPLDKESINILDILLQNKLPQVILCPMKWDVFYKNTPKLITFSKHDEKSAPPQQLFLDLLQQKSNKERIEILSIELCKITVDVLELDSIEKIGVKSDLFSMGMDSLTSLELRNKIYDKLQCSTLSLPIEYFINEPKIIKIAKHIANELENVFVSSRVKLISKNKAEEEISLCDAQYNFWSLYQLGNSNNCVMQFQLYGLLNVDYLSQAFDFTIQENSVFWTGFSNDAPLQRLNREGTFKLNYEDISSMNDRATLDEVFFDNVMSQMEFEKAPLIRVYLYKLDNNLHELHILIPHIIIDDSSYRILNDQFKQNYNALILGKKLFPKSESQTYFDYVKKNNELFEKQLSDKIDFWNAYNKGFGNISFGQENHLSDAFNQCRNIFNYPMEASVVDQFKTWHHEKNINVSTGLIALCQIIIYKLSRERKVPIGVIHSGREGSGFKSVIGLFIECKRINITLDESSQFVDFLKSIDMQFLKTTPYQKCMQVIKQFGLKNTKLSIRQHLIYAWKRLALKKKFKDGKRSSVVVDNQIKILSLVLCRNLEMRAKQWLNNMFRLKLPLLPPSPLSVYINVTSSFFIKQPRELKFSGLETNIPNHYGSMNRSIGNNALWIYFTADQYGGYRFAINGPLTPHCKDQMAEGVFRAMAAVIKNDNKTIADIIQELD